MGLNTGSGELWKLEYKEQNVANIKGWSPVAYRGRRVIIHIKRGALCRAKWPCRSRGAVALGVR